MTCVVRSNMLRTRGPVDQGGQGAAAERCARSARATHRVVGSGPEPVAQVWSVTTASLPIPRGGCATPPPSRSRRTLGSNYPQAPASHSAGAALVRETKRPDDGRDRQPRPARVSRHATKAWLSNVQIAARFKSISIIPLTACAHRSSHRPMRSWCPDSSVCLGEV